MEYRLTLPESGTRQPQEVSMATATPTVSSRQAADAEANRRVAVDFIEQAASGHAREVMSRYAAPDFVHHNPYFPSDAKSLGDAMDANARENPDKQFEVLRTIADGPLVALHGKVRHKPGDQPVAVVHIFRIEDGRIKELWDVGQEAVPNSPNKAGLF
jgi:predicted SnoaL-like aldol condensation-catalyzing enzyme